MPIKGIKGVSYMAVLNNFDAIYSHTIDYMHGVLIGVVKSTINLWMSSAKYMKKKQKEALGQRLLSIKPPSYISSRPRELEDIAKFKANEL